MSRARGLLAGCFASLVGMGAGTAANAAGVTGVTGVKPPTLDDTLATFAKAPGLQARFTEDKQIALLAAPLHSEGAIHFAPGRGLERETTKPSPEAVLVTDKDLVLWDGKSTRTVSLSSSKTLATFARAFSMLLAANRPALEQSFTLNFQPAPGVDPDAWTLDLTPLDPDLQKMLQSIHFEGRGIKLSILTINETNGDTTTTHFVDVDTAKHYTADEADRIFRLPPSPAPTSG